MEEIRRLLKIADEVIKQDAIKAKDVKGSIYNELKTRVSLLKGEPWAVLFAGQYNTGKSTLVNALYGEKVFDTGPVPTTEAFQEVITKDGLKVIDTEGFNAPNNNDGKIEIPNFHELVFVISEETMEEEKTYELLKSLKPKRPVFVVYNVKEEWPDKEEQDEIKKHILAKISTKSDIRVHNVFFINARSAERGIVEGKPKLYERSNIKALKTSLLRNYMDLKGGVMTLFTNIFKLLYPMISTNAQIGALYAEARVMFEIFYRNGESISLPPGAKLRREDFDSLMGMFNKRYIVELKPAVGDKLYTQIEDEEKPILEKFKLELPNEHAFLTLAGLEIRNGEIKRRGGELFIVNTRLYNTPVYADDVSHVFIIQTDIEKASPSLHIKGNSVLHAIRSSFDSRVSQWWDKSIDSVLCTKDCLKDGKEELKPGKSLKVKMIRDLEFKSFQETWSAYNKTASISPLRCEESIEKVRALFWLRRYEEAYNDSQIAYQLFKESAEANSFLQIMIGRVLLKLKRFDEALNLFSSTASSNDKDDISNQCKAGMALSYLGLNRLQDASRVVIGENFTSSFVYIAKGYVLIASNRLQKALEHFEKSIRLTDGNMDLLPDNCDAWEGKYVALLKQERHQEAIDAFEMAHRFDDLFEKMSNKAF